MRGSISARNASSPYDPVREPTPTFQTSNDPPNAFGDK